MGSGSNILMSDKGFDGILISLKRSFKASFLMMTKLLQGSGVMQEEWLRKRLLKT